MESNFEAQIKQGFQYLGQIYYHRRSSLIIREARMRVEVLSLIDINFVS